jgi:flap endonuclease-1
MIANGLKPCFVFDGKPPVLKGGELAKRTKKREEAEEGKKEAAETGDAEAVSKFAKRLVKVTPKHTDDAKKLLRLMGVPVIEAPCEAEAQCAALAKAGLVFATGTEDMDALTFGTPILLRHLTFSEARKMPIKEYHIEAVLRELKLTTDQFIDLCILLGCDYCDSIRGIGPVRAYEFITKYGSLEEIVKHLDPKKYPLPENFDFAPVRELFKNPEITDPKNIELKWKEADEEGLIEFLVKEKNFSEERVKNGLEKLKKARSGSVQNRLTNYFGTPVSVSSNTAKRKLEEKSKSPKIKRAKTAKGKK